MLGLVLGLLGFGGAWPVAIDRSIRLSPELDTENVDANLANGMLSLKILERAELQPREYRGQGAATACVCPGAEA